MYQTDVGVLVTHIKTAGSHTLEMIKLGKKCEESTVQLHDLNML